MVDWPALITATDTIPSRRRRAYTAGPYRASNLIGRLCNILARRAEAARLWKRGYAAFCPHMNSALMDGLISDEGFIEGDLSWLQCADVLVLSEGWRESEGAVREEAFARQLGLEVVYARDIELIPFMLQPEYEPWYVIRQEHWRTNPVDLVVVHHEGEVSYADTSAATINLYHTQAKGYAGIGYHVWIRKSGLLEVGRPLWAVGAHAKNHNHRSWGVCLDGNFDLRPPEPVQLEVLQTVLRYLDLLSPTWRLAGHRELPGMQTSCPGKLFPIDWLRNQMTSQLGREVS